MSVPRHEQAFYNDLNSRQIISFVAENAGGVVGFIMGGYERNLDDIYSGEIYTLYVLKNFQRQGIGGKLAAALATQFNQAGIYSMLVRVLKFNPYGWLDTSLIYD
jgi:ribosomal protein S18 acetylase RimI-like enzyme